MRKSRSVILTVSTCVSPLMADMATADTYNSKDQIKTIAQESVRDNCEPEEQAEFDWDHYAEEKILYSIIEQIRDNTLDYCTPPDLKTLGSPQDEEWKEPRN